RSRVAGGAGGGCRGGTLSEGGDADPGAKFYPHRVEGNVDGRVLQIKNVTVAAPPSASAVTSNASFVRLGRMSFGVFAGFAVLFAFILFEHSDNCERHVIDEKHLADRHNFASGLFWRAPDFVACGGADDANAASHIVIHLVEHAAKFDLVLVHLQRDRPNAIEQPGSEALSIRRDTC